MKLSDTSYYIQLIFNDGYSGDPKSEYSYNKSKIRFKVNDEIDCSLSCSESGRIIQDGTVQYESYGETIHQLYDYLETNLGKSIPLEFIGYDPPVLCTKINGLIPEVQYQWYLRDIKEGEDLSIFVPINTNRASLFIAVYADKSIPQLGKTLNVIEHTTVVLSLISNDDGTKSIIMKSDTDSAVLITFDPDTYMVNNNGVLIYKSGPKI